jgi:exodeoxyribonuclease-3
VVTALVDRPLVVVNVYAVNGTPKAYRDPATGAAAGDRHRHKRAFQDRVFDILTTADATVAVGDWNVSQAKIDVTPRLRTEAPHARARAELAAHCRRTGFVDAYRHLRPEARGYTWFARTSPGKLDAARVDFALVSGDLVGRVTRAIILDAPEARPGSDHAPILIELAAP